MKEQYSIEKSIGFIIYRSALKMKSTLQRILKDRGFDITPEQWGILRVLREEEGISQKEIGDRLFKDKPNVTRMLDVLERKGLIFRQPTDRRRYSIFLTKEGKKLQEELLPIVLQVQETATNSLTKSDLATLQNLLNIIYGNL
ncbi:MAG: MarR family transcriptional regulator [Deltaproteobacteria bacterium CG07_land_8_20_14_0_80_60_11]|nr:MAG: MarR family transcriptional regulator [Deltaproteobacteria bacterium CG07_land_8_20_14_0_80_60_11]